MDMIDSLNHTKWDCKYHVVFIPKCRRKTLYGQLRGHLGEVFRTLAQYKAPAATQSAPLMATQTAPPGWGELTH